MQKYAINSNAKHPTKTSIQSITALNTGCSICKVPKVRHFNTNKNTFLLVSCMSKMFSDMVHFIQKYILLTWHISTTQTNNHHQILNQKFEPLQDSLVLLLLSPASSVVHDHPQLLSHGILIFLLMESSRSKIFQRNRNSKTLSLHHQDMNLNIN